MTFALSDLRGRAPIHFGQGPNLTAYNLGQAGGAENVALTQTQMPAHSHAFAPGCNSQPSAVDQNLLRSSGAIHVESAYDRGSSWTAKFHHVDASLYQF